MKLKRIRELRKECSYTQKDLAKLLNTTQSQISKFETDSTTLSADILIHYAKLFDVSVDYILELSDVRNNKLSHNNNLLHDCTCLFNQLDPLNQRVILGNMASMIKEPQGNRKKVSNN